MSARHLKTRIIATIGPKSDSKETLFALVAAGMDIARMNFSHCTPEEYRSRQRYLQAAAKAAKREVKIMLDLQGPRIRVGQLPLEGVAMTEGKTYTFTTKSGEYEGGAIHITDPYLHLDVRVGDPMFLTSGEMELVITKIKGKEMQAKVIRGGVLFSNKGVNVPNTKLTTSGLTKKDIRDVGFGLKAGVDYIALSFVQSAKDVERLRKLIGSKSKVQIISKIERPIALSDIDKIIQASDGIMVARGDLGVELPMEELPIVQKHLIRHTHWHGKPVIVATQMMMSMVNHSTPTRAEVSDIANAIFEGADGVMLSDETAAGSYPVKAVATMHRIAARAEQYMSRENFFEPLPSKVRVR